MTCAGITTKGSRCRLPAQVAGYCHLHADSPFGRNRAALEQSIGHLATDPSHAALIEAARSLADQVDERPVEERLWREYRFALSALMGAATVDSDTLAEGLSELRRAALGNAQDSQ